MTPASQPEPERLGRYAVERRIAQGGMGSVYLGRLRGAHDFERLVAIKTLHQHLADDAQFRDMFLDEMRIASAINHPNVCAVLDFGMEGEIPYLVMEHCDGLNLAQILDRSPQPLPVPLIARVLADAARGLHAAHELVDNAGRPMHVVHRDLSPSNIIVLKGGGTKVLDFGIARATQRNSKTNAGTIKGTLAYVSPEQLSNKEIDRRADIWALGVVLWEALVGKRLFRGDSPAGTIANVMALEVTPPSGVRADVPKSMDKIVLECLQRDPARRMPTAEALADGLEAYLYETGTPFGMPQVQRAFEAIRIAVQGSARAEPSGPKKESSTSAVRERDASPAEALDGTTEPPPPATDVTKPVASPPAPSVTKPFASTPKVTKPVASPPAVAPPALTAAPAPQIPPPPPLAGLLTPRSPDDAPEVTEALDLSDPALELPPDGAPLEPAPSTEVAPALGSTPSMEVAPALGSTPSIALAPTPGDPAREKRKKIAVVAAALALSVALSFATGGDSGEEPHAARQPAASAGTGAEQAASRRPPDPSPVIAEPAEPARLQDEAPAEPEGSVDEPTAGDGDEPALETEPAELEPTEPSTAERDAPMHASSPAVARAPEPEASMRAPLAEAPRSTRSTSGDRERTSAMTAPAATAANGSVAVFSVPIATITIDGRPAGESPRVIEVPAGWHRFVLRADDGRQSSHRVRVEPGKRESLSVRF